MITPGELIEEKKRKEQEAKEFAERMNKKYNSKEREEFENKAEDEYNHQFNKHPERTQHPDFKKHLMTGKERAAESLKKTAQTLKRASVKFAKASKTAIKKTHSNLKEKASKRRAYLNSPEYKAIQEQKRKLRQERAKKFKEKMAQNQKRQQAQNNSFSLFGQPSNTKGSQNGMFGFGMFDNPQPRNGKRKAQQNTNMFIGIPESSFFGGPRQLTRGKKKKGKPPQNGGILGGVPSIFG